MSGDSQRAFSASARGLVLAIASITVLKAVAVLLFFQHPRVWEDGRMAVNLLQTGALFDHHFGINNHSIQAPLYAFMVAGLYRVGGIHPVFASLLNLLLNALTAWVLAQLFATLMDRIDVSGRLRVLKTPILWVCVLAFLLHPLISIYSMNNVHPFALDLLMFYAPFLLVVRYFERGCRTTDLALLGLATGVVLLERTVLVVNLVPFVLVAATMSGWRLALMRTAFVLAIGLLVGAPWLIRNYRTEGVIGYTSTTGEILWKGALRDSDGSNFLSDGRRYDSALSDADSERVRTLSVAEQNRFFARKYLETLRSEPGQVARMFVVKLKGFFWFRSLIGNEYSDAIKRFIPVYEVGYAAVLLLALLSIPYFGLPALLVWSPIVSLGVLQSVFYVETRHRVLIEPLLIFLAVLSIVAATSASRSSHLND